MKARLRHYLKDRYILALLDRIIETAPTATGRTDLCYFPGDDLLTPTERTTGLPIGNLTSQFFANLYLDTVDLYIKEQLHVRAYLRYVDDLVVLGRDKTQLHEIREIVREQLAKNRLRLHPRKAHIYHTAHGIDLFGYQVFPHKRRLRNDNGYAFHRRLRHLALHYREGSLDWEQIHPRVRSWIGHAIHGETKGLRKNLFSSISLAEGDAEPLRVLRGGSWNNEPQNVRSANRNRNAPANRNNNIGFRLASPPACCQGLPW